MSSPEPVPVLEYAPRDAEEIPHLGAMREWRRISGWGLFLTIPVLYIFGSAGLAGVAIVPLLAMLVGGICSLVFMTRAASRELGTGYALRQLVLATLLLPFLFAGVFLITRVVEADLQRHRLGQREE